MHVLNQVRIIVYRFHEKGLEIFLVNHDLESDPDVWRLPEGEARTQLQAVLSTAGGRLIELDPQKDADGNLIQTFALEGDWHDIPSIRGLIKYDIRLLKSKIREAFPELEKGGFFAIKEALKKVMPNEYAALRELKDILWDRNVLRNL
jgi:predicted NUDIX family NTP pyrophosphohydrolase